MLSFSAEAAPTVPCRSWLRHLMFCVLGALLIYEVAPACSVPVFRYGLEHWTADPYRVHIVHRVPLNAEAQALAQSLKEASARANLLVSIIDSTQETDSQVLAMINGAGAAESPTIIAQAP